MTISVAESVTCGQLASKIGSVSGASKYFKGGVVCYWLETKNSILDIPVKILENVNCVSESVAKEMAKNVCKLFNTDYGISTTGYAENPISYEKYISNKTLIEIPHAYICLYCAKTDKYQVKLIKDENKIYNRVEMQKYIVQNAYELIKKII